MNYQTVLGIHNQQAVLGLGSFGQSYHVLGSPKCYQEVLGNIKKYTNKKSFTVIFKFNHVYSFLHFLSFGQNLFVTLSQYNKNVHWLTKKSSFYPFCSKPMFSLQHCTDSIRQMSLINATNAKTVNMVKIENHFNNKN